MSILLQVKNLRKTYNGRVLLDETSFTVAKKQKIAVIGRNGAGKSTLFRIITNQEKQDDGDVTINSETRLGYLKQEDDFHNDDTVLSYLLRESGREDWECAKTAAIFELKNGLLEKPISELSGGFQMRVKLTSMLLKQPNLLLLDEPTNYLDLSTMLLLEKFLKNYKGAYLIISHDRRFIKNVCNEIIDIENGKAYHFPNGLEAYLKFKKEKIVFAEKFNKKQEKKIKHLQSFIDRFGAKASLAKQAKSKEKQIDKLKTIDIENSLKTVSINIPEADTKKGLAWRMEDLSIGYPDKTIAKNIELNIEKGEHLAVLGDNGQGKSTFLKTLAGKINPIEGTFKPNQKLRIAYYAQHITEELNPKETVESFLTRSAVLNHNAEDIYKMAGDFLFTDEDIKKPISVLSGGEKARLCLAGILLRRHDVLLLDEPTNHLDFETAENLAFSLAESNATILFISHDRTFTNIIAEKILEVKDKQVKTFYGSYDDYIDYLEQNFSPENRLHKSKEKISAEKQAKREKYENEKQLKKDITRLEKLLEKLKQEKDAILKYFEENPTKISPEKANRLKEINEEIQETEKNWFEFNENLYA
jgi:ATP-binding cassette subfamily F protein 3